MAVTAFSNSSFIKSESSLIDRASSAIVFFAEEIIFFIQKRYENKFNINYTKLKALKKESKPTVNGW